MLLLFVVVVALGGVLVSYLKPSAQTINSDKVTAAALARAKEALIGWSANAPIPGTLLCPDMDNNGTADPPCGLAGVSVLGRLPWKTLGLPDLRDGSGECLWYAVSGVFKNSPPTSPLNSDTNGQFTIMSSDGVTPLAGGSPATMAIAVVFAPGSSLPGNNRSPSAATICGGNTTAANYLDTSSGINNATVATNTFIAANTSSAFNDRLIYITPEQFFTTVEKRVAREARICLNEFSLQAGANNRFPWAAPLTDVTTFADMNGTLFGRIPNTLTATNTSLGTALNWPNPVQLSTVCFASGTWWDSWREHLFYHVAQAYQPDTVATGSCPANCLTVNTTDSVKTLVVVAGRSWPVTPNQTTRSSNKTDATFYLETAPTSSINNANGGATAVFAKAQTISTGTVNFNDKTECLQSLNQPPCQ